MIFIKKIKEQVEEQNDQVVTAVTLLSSLTISSKARFLTFVDKQSTKYRNLVEQIETKTAKYVSFFFSSFLSLFLSFFLFFLFFNFVLQLVDKITNYKIVGLYL